MSTCLFFVFFVKNFCNIVANELLVKHVYFLYVTGIVIEFSDHFDAKEFIWVIEEIYGPPMEDFVIKSMVKPNLSVKSMLKTV